MLIVAMTGFTADSFSQAPVACIYGEDGQLITVSDTTICRRTAIKLKGEDCSSPGNLTTSYVWVNLTFGGAPFAGQELQTLQNGEYELSVTNLSGITSTIRINVLYKPEPAGGFSINNNAVFVPKCSYVDTALHASKGAGIVNYKWYKATLSSPVIATGPDYILSENLTGTISYYVTADYTVTGCQLLDNIPVRYLEAPKPDLGKDTVLCTGQSLTLIPGGLTNPPADYQFLWYNSSAFATGDNQRTINTAGSYTVTVKGPLTNTCQYTDTINVTYNPTPVLNTVPTVSICYGDTLIMTNTLVTGAPGPYTYTWSPNTQINDVSLQAPKIYPTASSTTYTVTVTAKNCSDTKTRVITVNPKITVNLNFADSTLCPGGSANILASATGGSPSYTYTWTPATGITGAATASPTVSPSVPVTYMLQVKDNKNCKADTSVNIGIQSNVAPLVSASVAFADSTVCPGASIQLSSSGSGGSGPYSYSWTGSGITNGNTSTPGITPAASSTYTVAVKDSRNCQATAAVNIDMLWVDLGNDDELLGEYGETIVLDAQNSSTAGYTFRWEETTSGTVVGTSPSFPATVTGDYTVYVTDGICSVSDSKKVTFLAEIVQKVYVPNVFSPALSEPNNSNLRVFGNNIANRNFSFKVFNQWGELVYTSDNYQDAHNSGWNGSFNNTGQPLNSGVYTYSLQGEFKDETPFEHAGTVTLIR